MSFTKTAHWESYHGSIIRAKSIQALRPRPSGRPNIAPMRLCRPTWQAITGQVTRKGTTTVCDAARQTAVALGRKAPMVRTIAAYSNVALTDPQFKSRAGSISSSDAVALRHSSKNCDDGGWRSDATPGDPPAVVISHESGEDAFIVASSRFGSAGIYSSVAVNRHPRVTPLEWANSATPCRSASGPHAE